MKQNPDLGVDHRLSDTRGYLMPPPAVPRWAAPQPARAPQPAHRTGAPVVAVAVAPSASRLAAALDPAAAAAAGAAGAPVFAAPVATSVVPSAPRLAALDPTAAARAVSLAAQFPGFGIGP